MRVAAFALVVVWSGVALAAPEGGPRSPSFGGAVSLGLGAPLGVLGLSAVIRPLSWLDVDGGVGLGVSGEQLSISARAAYPLESSSVGIGAGLSHGPYTEYPEGLYGDGGDLRYDSVTWLNVEAFVEIRASAKHYVRIFGGAGHPVTWELERVSDDSPMSALPFVGVALGAWLGGR